VARRRRGAGLEAEIYLTGYITFGYQTAGQNRNRYSIKSRLRANKFNNEIPRKHVQVQILYMGMTLTKPK